MYMQPIISGMIIKPLVGYFSDCSCCVSVDSALSSF